MGAWSVLCCHWIVHVSVCVSHRCGASGADGGLAGENMGYAHVVYGRAEEAQRAVGHMDKGQIDGRILSVRLDAPPPERYERRRERDRHGYARRHADRWEPSRGSHAAHTRWQPRNRDSQPDREPPRAGSDPAHRPRRRTPSPPHRHRRPSPEYGHAYAPRRRSRSRSPPPPRRTSPTYD